MLFLISASVSKQLNKKQRSESRSSNVNSNEKATLLSSDDSTDTKQQTNDKKTTENKVCMYSMWTAIGVLIPVDIIWELLCFVHSTDPNTDLVL